MQREVEWADAIKQRKESGTYLCRIANKGQNIAVLYAMGIPSALAEK